MMDWELAVRWFKGIVILAVAAWEVSQLTRRPRDLPLRVLVPGLVALAFAATLGIKDVLDPLKELVGDEAWTHLVNGSWSLMAYSFAAYFLLANPTVTVARRKRAALVEFAILIAVLTVMVAVHIVFPATFERPKSFEQYASLPNIIWYLTVDGYALIVWFIGVFRAQSLRQHLRNRWARASFWLVIIGSAAMTLGVNAISLIRQAYYILIDASADLDLLSTLYSTGQLAGQCILALGLALAPLAASVAALRSRIEHRERERFAQQLQPLWHLLTTEFPYVSVPETRSTAYERYTAEITDSLAELARDCPEPGDDIRDPQTAAAAISAGLHRRASRHKAEENSPPYPRIEPEFATWRQRAQWMAALSQYLPEHQRVDHDATT